MSAGICGRNGIAAAATPRMAPRDALQPEPSAMHGSVLFHGFEKIHRATRFETAARPRSGQPQQERRKRPAVEVDEHADQRFHAFKYPARAASARHSSVNIPDVAAAAARRKTTTIHNPAGRSMRCVRKISRNRRRTLTRSQALPTLREVTTPMRQGCFAPVENADKTIKRPCHARPCSLTASNSARRESRADFGNASAPIKPRKNPALAVKPPCASRNEPRRPWAAGACGRAADGGKAWRDRPWSSCAHGIRAAVCACAWMVGKFFSWVKKICA